MHCFEEYGIIMDGTPSFTAAECIIIRIDSRLWDIHEFVKSLGLFDFFWMAGNWQVM